jgi:site-specific recombinase XerC
MFLLMLRCGLRVSEIRNLSLNDLYLQAAPGALPRLWLHGKGGSQRVVYLSAQAQAALSAWMKIRPTFEDQAVFLNKFGKRFSVTGIQYCGSPDLSGIMVKKPSGRASGSDQSYDSQSPAD